MRYGFLLIGIFVVLLTLLGSLAQGLEYDIGALTGGPFDAGSPWILGSRLCVHNVPDYVVSIKNITLPTNAVYPSVVSIHSDGADGAPMPLELAKGSLTANVAFFSPQYNITENACYLIYCNSTGTYKVSFASPALPVVGTHMNATVGIQGSGNNVQYAGDGTVRCWRTIGYDLLPEVVPEHRLNSPANNTNVPYPVSTGGVLIVNLSDPNPPTTHTWHNASNDAQVFCTNMTTGANPVNITCGIRVNVGAKVRLYVNDTSGGLETKFGDFNWTITDPEPPVIVSWNFSVTNASTDNRWAATGYILNVSLYRGGVLVVNGSSVGNHTEVGLDPCTGYNYTLRAFQNSTLWDEVNTTETTTCNPTTPYVVTTADALLTLGIIFLFISILGLILWMLTWSIRAWGTMFSAIFAAVALFLSGLDWFFFYYLITQSYISNFIIENTKPYLFVGFGVIPLIFTFYLIFTFRALGQRRNQVK